MFTSLWACVQHATLLFLYPSLPLPQTPQPNSAGPHDQGSTWMHRVDTLLWGYSTHPAQGNVHHRPPNRSTSSWPCISIFFFKSTWEESGPELITQQVTFLSKLVKNNNNNLKSIYLKSQIKYHRKKVIHEKKCGQSLVERLKRHAPVVLKIHRIQVSLK